MADSVFVHAKHVEGQIVEGDKVTFNLEKTPKGWNAINVVKA